MLLASLAYLTTEEYLQSKSSQNHAWWSLYFDEPKGASLDAIIENHGVATEYRWEIYLEKNMIAKNSAIIKDNEQKKIPITSVDLSGRKVTIRVYKGDEKRELYKIIK